jgi:hypothetical protein
MTKILTNKSNIDLDYPICRPSLDLDFTQEELDPRITFTRGSIGTRVNRNRVIETVAANTPRFDYDPVTGECKGLLIEESRSNLFTYSDDAATAWGIKSGLTVSANTDIAPDGNQTMDTLVEDAARNDKYLERQITVNANQNITWSCYVKPLRRTNIFLVIYDGASYSNNVNFRYEFSNQTVTLSAAFGTGTFGSYSVVYVGNGVYRMVLSGQPTTSASTSVRIRIGFVNQSSTYTGTGVSAAAVWGAQLEVGAFPTSYIPTSASTVTRSADLADMTGTNFSSWYNQSEGTLYADLNNITTRTSLTFDRLVSLVGTDVNRNAISICTQTAAGGGAQNKFLAGVSYSPDGSYVLDTFTGVVSGGGPDRIGKAIIVYKKDNFAFTVNGITPLRDIIGDIPTCNRLLIFGAARYQPAPSGHIKRLTYYPRALKPNQLVLLTQ